MRKLKNIMLMLVALVLATSCIKEDYDDCDNVTIYFQYLADVGAAKRNAHNLDGRGDDVLLCFTAS